VEFVDVDVVMALLFPVLVHHTILNVEEDMYHSQHAPYILTMTAFQIRVSAIAGILHLGENAFPRIIIAGKSMVSIHDIIP